MPTYEYRCTACGHQFEEVQRISEPAIERCPKCKKKKARRLISQGNFILKGGGWYVTDYKSGGRAKKLKDKESESSSTSTSTDDKKSDDKKSDDKKSDDKKSESKDDKPRKAAKD